MCVCVCAGPGNPQYLPLGLEHHVTFAGKVFLIVDIFGSEEYSFSKTTTAVEHQKDRGPSNNISCGCFTDPVCKTKHDIAQKDCSYLIEDLKPCNLVTLKRPHISKINDHDDTA